MVDLLQPDHRIERVAVAHADAAQEKLLVELQRRFPPDWSSPQSAVRVLHTGIPELLTELTPAILEAHARSPEHAELLRRIGVRSHMSVPLVARGRILGALNLGVTAGARRYGPEDLSFAEDAAARAALAIDNARLYQDATTAIRVRDEFLSIASHELKTPLTPLQLQVRGLLSKLDELTTGAPPREWLEPRLARIARQGDRLERLVNEMLDVANISGGRLTLQLDEVDLAGVVREVEERLEQTGEIRRWHGAMTIDAPERLVGRWDPLRVEQIVEALLCNALKYGAGKPIAVGAATRGDSAVLTVQDHGIGISAADRQRIFGRFERAVSARRYGGLGVGLYLVRQLAEALGGEVEVESAAGYGSTFRVTLPLAGPEPNGREHPPPPDDPAHPPTAARH